MIELFKRIPILVRFYPNEIEVKRLDNNNVLKRQAKYKYSTNRLVLADFNNAEILLSQLIKEILGGEILFLTKIVLVIQQMHEFPDGISEVEKRAYRDLAEHSGAIQAIVLNGMDELTNDRIKTILKNK
jgi:hypothetical protein